MNSGLWKTCSREKQADKQIKRFDVVRLILISSELDFKKRFGTFGHSKMKWPQNWISHVKRLQIRSRMMINRVEILWQRRTKNPKITLSTWLLFLGWKFTREKFDLKISSDFEKKASDSKLKFNLRGKNDQFFGRF